MSEWTGVVLDASSLLALLRGEAGATVVEPLLGGAMISAVNWSEVCQRSLAAGIDVVGLRADVEGLGVHVVPFDVSDAEQAADLWPVTRDAGLSLGDRACLALAIERGLPAVTADRSWLQVDVGAEVRAIR